jgi:catechol 2,3-dioxygenase-like lactoylglutathione lyase family enzyme
MERVLDLAGTRRKASYAWAARGVRRALACACGRVLARGHRSRLSRRRCTGAAPAVLAHLWIRVADVAASRRFYETVARQTGFSLRTSVADRAQFQGESGSSFSVVAGTPTENVHLAFMAGDNETVEAFHRAATGAGYRDNGAPGERAVYHAGYYGAFVLDPDSSSALVIQGLASPLRRPQNGRSSEPAVASVR